MDKSFLTKWKLLQDWKTYSNLAFLMSVIDLGSQTKVNFETKKQEQEHQVKLEFYFPKIERERKDWTKSWHIRWEVMKVSNFKSSSPDMNNAKMVNVMIALWAQMLPLDSNWCIEFMKQFLGKPLIIESEAQDWKDWHRYDKITSFKPVPKEHMSAVVTPTDMKLTHFDLSSYTQEEFDKLNSWDIDTIKKSAMFNSPQKLDEEIDVSSLPF